ncbi:unnamed protein product [Rotaria magnacalcarata]|uniref:Uncharacterized protein n=1 Tax=Rotaria magnacalcarata TaxID=392030 RepID=A0A815FSL3_9BILA|nr:unnamed protein product [Rotaria magnacalcarata]
MPLLSLKIIVENLERIITKVTENANTSKERSISPAHGLSQDESASICLYIMDEKINEKSLCRQLNAALRSKDRSELVPYLISCVDSLDDIQSDRLLGTRGIRTIFKIECQTGKAISKHSYYDDIREVLSQNRPSTDVCIIHLREIESSVSYLQSPLTSSNLNNSMFPNNNKRHSTATSPSAQFLAKFADVERCKSSLSRPKVEIKVMKTVAKSNEKKS